MTTALTLLKNLPAMDQAFIGTVRQQSAKHWLIGEGEHFPLHIESLEQKNRFIIYGTGIRNSAEPVETPIMTTQFLENLVGYCLGNYGICAGPVTLTIYQVITAGPDYSLDRLAAEIVCHRMLVECFLESDFDPEQDWPKTVQDLEDVSPILPFAH